MICDPNIGDKVLAIQLFTEKVQLSQEKKSTKLFFKTLVCILNTEYVLYPTNEFRLMVRFLSCSPICVQSLIKHYIVTKTINHFSFSKIYSLCNVMLKRIRFNGFQSCILIT